MPNKIIRFAYIIFVMLLSQNTIAEISKQEAYANARWDPIHFSPQIEKATDEQCLNCHQNILEDKPLASSPAGLKSTDSMAWYQTLNTYQGEQDSFHRRHLTSDYSTQVMDLSCNTCHQGNDPREENNNSSATTQADLTMRRHVDPYVCLLCHGQSNFTKMGLPKPWVESSAIFGDSCLTCHVAIKTERHVGIDFLKRDKIEEMAATDSDVCFGCHGGRAWYSVWFPYSEKSWPGHGQAPLGARHKYPKLESGDATAQIKNQ